jgi:hypothetical protein
MMWQPGGAVKVAATPGLRLRVVATRRRPSTWTPEEREREERARAERMRRDAQRDPAANLEEGAAFTRFAHEFAAAFRAARRRR